MISPRAAIRFAALSETVRLQILLELNEAQGELDVEGLAAVLRVDGRRYKQPTVSHHLRILVEAGFLAIEKRGLRHYYHLCPGTLSDAIADLRTLRARPLSWFAEKKKTESEESIHLS